MITQCSCKNEYQDEKHGEGNRVGNETKKNTARCTICGKETSIKK